MSEKLLPLNPEWVAEGEGAWLTAWKRVVPGTMIPYKGARARTAKQMYYYLRRQGTLPEGLKIRTKNIGDKEEAQATIYREAPPA